MCLVHKNSVCHIFLYYLFIIHFIFLIEIIMIIFQLLDKAPGNPANDVNKDTAEKDSDQQHCNDNIQIPAWYSFDDVSFINFLMIVIKILRHISILSVYFIFQLTLQSLGGQQTSLTSSHSFKERKVLKPPWKQKLQLMYFSCSVCVL